MEGMRERREKGGGKGKGKAEEERGKGKAEERGKRKRKREERKKRSEREASERRCRLWIHAAGEWPGPAPVQSRPLLIGLETSFTALGSRVKKYYQGRRSMRRWSLCP